MGKYATTLFRLLLHTYNVELNRASSNINSAQVGYLTKLVVSLSCALLQSLGKDILFCLYCINLCIIVLYSCVDSNVLRNTCLLISYYCLSFIWFRQEKFWQSSSRCAHYSGGFCRKHFDAARRGNLVFLLVLLDVILFFMWRVGYIVGGLI